MKRRLIQDLVQHSFIAFALAACACAAGAQQAPAAAPGSTAVYKDPHAPMEQRVDDLLARMTLEEKVSQMMSDSVAIPRLDIPAYNWWNECLHGVARAGRATVFPETIGLAATWDTELIGRVANAISDEARAKHEEFVRRGKRNIYQGLTFWTPNINIFRDPRWGRGMETYGEDPFLTGRMAVSFIRGLQGDDPKYFKVIATAKHYAVHSGPESSRHTFDAIISESDLRSTYLPQFEMAVKEGGAYSVMCAYNRVDGQAACASPQLEGILRNDWKFKGYIVSDCGAIGDIYLHHKVASTAEAGVADAVKSGTDLNCGTEYTHLTDAVHQGLLPEAEVNQSVRRLLTARFKLGMFDPASMVKWARIPYSVNDSPEHRALALETARKAIVLLKNDNHALPLSKTLKTVAVIGPIADDLDVLNGNYNGDPSEPVTPLVGIRRKLASVVGTNVIYARGSEIATNMPSFEVIPTSALSSSDDASRQPGLKGEYFADSNFDGKLHRPAELTYPGSGKMAGSLPAAGLKPVMTRVDPKVEFRWWEGAPSKELPDDNFGVRWTGYISAPVTGKYYLGAHGLNAFELYFNNKQIVAFNNIHERSYGYEAVEMEAGKKYPIRLDYHEYVGDADIRLLWSRPDPPGLKEAVAAAKQADHVIMILGLSPRLEGEEMKVPVEGFSGGDRIKLGMPQSQEDLLKAIVATGKPVTLVLMNGSALAINWASEHVPAIVEAWYPGQAGGSAIADVLFGDYNPAGRLPVTFYKSEKDLPAFDDYNMKGRTYRYFEGEPLYPFGFGLSYTNFTYHNLILPKSANAGDGLKVKVDVENSGVRAGEEVVELYLKAVGATWDAPIRALAGLHRIALKPGERRTVEFMLNPKQFAHVDGSGKWIVDPAKFEVSVGGKQPGFKGALDAATTQVVGNTIEITGHTEIHETNR